MSSNMWLLVAMMSRAAATLSCVAHRRLLGRAGQNKITTYSVLHDLVSLAYSFHALGDNDTIEYFICMSAMFRHR